MVWFPTGKVTTTIGMGCAYLTRGYSLSESGKLVNIAYDRGVRHFDVAPQYGRGTAERVLGHALRGVRDTTTITSKFGITRGQVSYSKLIIRDAAIRFRKHVMGDKPRIIRPRDIGGALPQTDFSATTLENCLTETLRELKTDYVDAYLLHEVRKSDMTYSLVEKMIALKAAGKVGSIGLATNFVETKEILREFPGIFDIVQYSWSVLDTEKIETNQPFLITHRAVMLAFGPLLDLFHSKPAMCRELSERVQQDLANPKILSSVLVGASIQRNQGGITLTASRSDIRLRQNLEAAFSDEMRSAGERLVSALADTNNTSRTLSV